MWKNSILNPLTLTSNKHIRLAQSKRAFRPLQNEIHRVTPKQCYLFLLSHILVPSQIHVYERKTSQKEWNRSKNIIKQ
jgi:hypothetical protein